MVILISELHQSSMIKEESRELELIHLVLQSQDMKLKVIKFHLQLAQTVFQLMFVKKCHLHINMINSQLLK